MTARTRDQRTTRVRTGDLTPWARPKVRELHVPEQPATARDRSTPVFVDESGRRHRAIRLVACGLAAAVLGYVVVVALTFAGVPFVGRLTPPGVERLARPGPGSGAVVGPGAEESPLPPAAVGPPDDPAAGPGTPGSTDTPASGGDAGSTIGPATTATSVPSTTTTTARGNGPPTSQPTSSSTVPDRTHPTGGGPPDTPPGQT
jgi:hypothetical protein